MLKKIIKNKKLEIVSIYMIANMINKAIGFITVPIFSHMLSTSEYGLASTYLSYVLILQYFMGLSSEYTVRNAYVDFRDELPQYMSSMFLLTSFSAIFSAILIVVLNSFCLYISSTLICFCCVVQSFMTYINNAMTNKLMMDKSYKKRAVITAGPNLLSALLGIVFVIIFAQDRYFGRVLGYVLAVSIFGLYGLLSTWSVSKPRINKIYWKYILKISPPLIIHGLSMVVLSQIDRIMITSIRSSGETAIYSVVYSLSMIAMAITSAIEGIWTPWFTKKYIEKDYKAINMRANQYLEIVSVLMVGIMFISPEVLKIMTPGDYWNGINMIPPLVLSSYFIYMYSFFVNLELLEKQTKRIALITVIAAIINIVLNFMLIPKYGTFGASATTLLSYIVSFCLHSAYGRKINRSLFELKDFLLPAIVITCSMLLFYLFMNVFVVRWLLAILIIGLKHIINLLFSDKEENRK